MDIAARVIIIDNFCSNFGLQNIFYLVYIAYMVQYHYQLTKFTVNHCKFSTKI